CSCTAMSESLRHLLRTVKAPEITACAECRRRAAPLPCAASSAFSVDWALTARIQLLRSTREFDLRRTRQRYDLKRGMQRRGRAFAASVSFLLLSFAATIAVHPTRARACTCNPVGDFVLQSAGSTTIQIALQWASVPDATTYILDRATSCD